MERMNPEEVVRKAIDAFNRHDLDGYYAMIDPGYVGYDPLEPEPVRGKEASRKASEGLFKAIPDFKFGVLNIMTKSDMVAVETRWSGTLKGPFELPGGLALPPTGRHFESRLVLLFRVSSVGLITEIRDYWYDLAGFLQQLGIKM